MIRNNKETNWRLRMLFQDSDELARAAIATTSSVAITIRVGRQNLLLPPKCHGSSIIVKEFLLVYRVL
ncbi:hypothetical protein Plhal304r1_c018g0065831 [Plasmopara halstedii]